MDFDKWCTKHGVYLNDKDDAARAAKAMARAAWQAGAASERKRCVKVCDEVTVKMNAECPSAVNGWWPDQVGYACIKAIQRA